MDKTLDSNVFSHSHGVSGDFEAPKKTFVRELADGQAVDTIFMARERKLATKRNGESYARIGLADSSGNLAAVCWDDAEAAYELASPGAAVRVHGRYSVDERYGAQLTIRSL